MIARGERPADIDLARTRDPFILVRAAREALESVRVALLGNDDAWREVLARDGRIRGLVTNELYVAAANLARLTVLVESSESTDPDLYLDLADHAEELHELRAEIAARKVPA